MKFKLTKVTGKEYENREIVEIEKMLYDELGISPSGTHHYIRRIQRDEVMAHLEKKEDGTMIEVIPVFCVTEFLMNTEYPAEYFQIRAIVKRRLPNFKIKLGW